MPDQQDTKPKPCCGGLFRFHRSTLLIALLILLPWLLIALPGRIDEVENAYPSPGGWTPASYLPRPSHQRHGLPLVFLERRTDLLTDVWRDEFFCYSNSFWSNPARWPWSGNGEVIQVHWWGLLVDVLLILFLFLLFACVVEDRLENRGSRFKFSLAEILVATCIAGAFVAWISTEYRRAAKENYAIAELMDAMSESGGHIDVGRNNCLPVHVSELLDHRSSIPLLKNRLFRPVEQAEIILPDDPKETAGDIIDAVGSIHFPIDLEVNVNEHNLPILTGVKNWPPVRYLDLYFNFDPIWYDACRDEIDWDLKAEFSAVKTLEVSLQPGIDQKKQLGFFASMRHVERLKVNGLNRAGAIYLNSIAKELPSDTWIRFGAGEEKIELLAPMNQ